jgi:hypothetical protein
VARRIVGAWRETQSVVTYGRPRPKWNNARISRAVRVAQNWLQLSGSPFLAAASPQSRIAPDRFGQVGKKQTHVLEELAACLKQKDGESALIVALHLRVSSSSAPGVERFKDGYAEFVAAIVAP